jgi:hypothetical protein
VLQLSYELVRSWVLLDANYDGWLHREGVLRTGGGAVHAYTVTADNLGGHRFAPPQMCSECTTTLPRWDTTSTMRRPPSSSTSSRSSVTWPPFRAWQPYYS